METYLFQMQGIIVLNYLLLICMFFPGLDKLL